MLHWIAMMKLMRGGDALNTENELMPKRTAYKKGEPVSWPILMAEIWLTGLRL